MIKSICTSLNKKHPPATRASPPLAWTGTAHAVARQPGTPGVIWPRDENQMLFYEPFPRIRRWSVHGAFGALAINITLFCQSSSWAWPSGRVRLRVASFFSNRSQNHGEVPLCRHKPGIACLRSELENVYGNDSKRASPGGRGGGRG